MQLLTTFAHHGEPADPKLLGWLMDLIDQFVSVGPVAVIVIIGAAMILLPLAIVIAAIRWRRRAGKAAVPKG